MKASQSLFLGLLILSLGFTSSARAGEREKFDAVGVEYLGGMITALGAVDESLHFRDRVKAMKTELRYNGEKISSFKILKTVAKKFPKATRNSLGVKYLIAGPIVYGLGAYSEKHAEETDVLRKQQESIRIDRSAAIMDDVRVAHSIK